MLDAERNPRNSYKINGWDNYKDDTWIHATVYREGKAGTMTGTYPATEVPKWVLDSMKVLDAAAENGIAYIPGFGHVMNGDYWFMAEQTKSW
jgi:hypothetical protein